MNRLARPFTSHPMSVGVHMPATWSVLLYTHPNHRAAANKRSAKTAMFEHQCFCNTLQIQWEICVSNLKMRWCLLDRGSQLIKQGMKWNGLSLLENMARILSDPLLGEWWSSRRTSNHRKMGQGCQSMKWQKCTKIVTNKLSRTGWVRISG